MNLYNRIWYIFMACIISLLPMLVIAPILVIFSSDIFFFKIGPKFLPWDVEGFNSALLGLGIGSIISIIIYITITTIIAKLLIKRYQS